MNDPTEYILHASPGRVRGMGIFIVVSHLLFGLLWWYAPAKTFDSLTLRFMLLLSGLALIAGTFFRSSQIERSKLLLCSVVWLNLPLYFSFMYVMNGFSDKQLASMAAVILIYYQVSDWRIATVGTLFGALLAGGLGLILQAPHATPSLEHGLSLVFIWALALYLGYSRFNGRRAQLAQTVNTMAVMVHEVQPAIAAMSLVGKALRNEARATTAPLQADRLQAWGNKLMKLSTVMQAALVSQVANAHLSEMGLPGDTELLHASELVQEVVSTYPYLKYEERGCIEISIRRDFSFVASRRQFAQVFSNLIRNGLISLAATQRTLVNGDLLIEVGVFNEHGRIVITDRGIGMSRETLHRAFEAFYSTHKRTGHGLGLTFCRQIVGAAGGSINVESVSGFGATFTIEFPRIRASGSSHGNSGNSTAEQTA